MTYESLVELSKKKGLLLQDEHLEKLKKYLSCLLAWNEKFNLTAITDEGQAIEKHFYDCLMAIDLPLFEKALVADIGSGAGFPGLVWAIVCPQTQFTLIDSTQKKCLFLEEMVKELNLPNVKVICQRAEELPSSLKEGFDVVSARAVAELRILLELGAPLLKVGGTFLALKGSKGEEELKKASRALKKLGFSLTKIEVFHLPSEQAERQNIFLCKEKKTEGKYPRRYGEIVKNPL